jgi:hypothetical protein
MDLDAFYSEHDFAVWRHVLGSDLHYHFGIGGFDTDPFEQAIINLFPYLEPGSNVLDCGCGWGGPARLLMNRLGCRMTGVTVSKAQAESIHDFPVIHSDLHYYNPTETYDTAIFIESFTHLRDPVLVLNSLRDSVDSIIVKDFLVDSPSYSDTWSMHFRTEKIFVDILRSSGFLIQNFNEIDNFWFPSVDIWYSRMSDLNPFQLNGQLARLYSLCRSIRALDAPILASLGIRQCEILATRIDR